MAITEQTKRRQQAARQRKRRAELREMKRLTLIAENNLRAARKRTPSPNAADLDHDMTAAFNYNFAEEHRKAERSHTSCGYTPNTADTETKLQSRLNRYLKGKREYANHNGLAFDKAAMTDALLASELWLAWALHDGPLPHLLRRDRNRGYVAGNILVGNDADKLELGNAHLQQRRLARNRGSYRAIGSKPN